MKDLTEKEKKVLFAGLWPVEPEEVELEDKPWRCENCLQNAENCTCVWEKGAE